ncbi:uncharacterized protein LOC126334934 [Schistocerca gregaria]|uniref:uncharacterized protein LOC126334934 n=1 Tax=Schistocerca gregaria TaxID=7010 RepID=UPI00211E950A|nr:uncharacterized protein LOC126334934 [Schistocerca gregaria]
MTIILPCQAFPVKLYNSFKNIHLRLHKTIQHIKYNQTCKINNVIPSYINVKVRNNSFVAQKTKSFAEKTWLENEIKSLYTKKLVLNRMLYDLHLELSAFINNPTVMINIIQKIEHITARTLQYTHNIHERKIKTLTSKNNHRGKYDKVQHTHQHKFHPKLINLTDIELTEKETQLLEKGLKHNISTKIDNHYIENLIVETESILTQEEKNKNNTINIGLTRELVKKEINNIITMSKKEQNSKLQTEKNTTKKLKEKLQANNIIVTRADKGNSTVLINNEQYIEKTMDFISSNNITKLKSDPTARFQTYIKNNLREIRHILTDKQKQHITQKNPKAPTLRSQPKVHKPHIPLRPVINFMKAPSYHVAKHMNIIIMQHYEMKNSRTVKNTNELITHIKDLHIPQTASLISFDIENMYTSIPTADTIKLIEENLLTHNKLPVDNINEITKTLKLITSQNYFQFEKEFYLQEDGLPMGSPISATLANIFINYIENTIFDTVIRKKGYKIVYWYRYVDDIICMVDEPTEKIDKLHTDINNIHKNIQFTIEKETQKQIHFLDITIKRENNKHTFDIFRKPTATDIIIHASSNHPQNHKLAALRHMLHRLNNIPLSKENYEKELQTIQLIATNNGYSTHIVQKLNEKIKTQLKKNENKQRLQNPTNTTAHTETQNNNTHDMNNRKKWYTLTYKHKTTHKIANILKKQGLQIAYRTRNTLQSHLQTTEKPDKYQGAGIYQLECQECKAVYLGMTSRNFKTRYKEHIRSWKYENSHSTFAEHLIKHGHEPSNMECDMTVIRVNNHNKNLLTLQENFHIQRAIAMEKKVLNDQIHINNNSLIMLATKTTTN